MTLEMGFWIAQAVSLTGWVALLVRPGPGSVRVARWAAALLAVGYLILFLANAREAAVLARDYSLSGVAAFFSVRELILVGWVHILAFDLMVGSWEAEEAERTGMRRGAVVLCLVLTFMLEPVGLLLFLVLRGKKTPLPAGERGESASLLNRLRVTLRPRWER
jgi:hypothetical protein